MTSRCVQRFRVAILLFLATLCATTPALAQRADRATISGVVTDNQSAPVPGATVTIKNESDATNPAAGKLGSVQIVVPSGLTVISVGNFSNAWGTNWAAGQTITVGATGPGAGTNKLAPGASMTFTIGVDATLCLKNDFTTLLGASGTLGDTFTADWTRVGGGVSVTVTGCSTETECPAAQAIANAYLDSIGFVGSRGGINSAISAHTTDGNHFDGMSPCDTGYAAAVIAFVQGLLA